MDSYLEKPLVSILVLSMNHEKYIRQCLMSCIEQTHVNKEIVFLDNCSKDKTPAIAVEVLSASSIPFTVLENKASQPISVNINKLISASKGEYIVIISGDDWMKPNNAEKKIKLMLDNPNNGLVYSCGFIYYEDTKQLKRNPSERNFKRGSVEKEIFRSNFVFTPGVLIRRSVLDTTGGFDELCPVEDYDMWLRIAAVSNIDFVDEPLVFYRQHSSNISANTEFMRNSHIYLLEKYKGHKYYDELKLHFQYSEIYYAATHSVSLKGLLLILTKFRLTAPYFRILILWAINFFRSFAGNSPKR